MCIIYLRGHFVFAFFHCLEHSARSREISFFSLLATNLSKSGFTDLQFLQAEGLLPPFFLPQWSASRLRGQMSTPSQKWNIDNAFCNDLNHGVVMVQLRIRCASTLKRKKRGLRQTSLNQGKWPNLSFVIRRKEGGVSYVIHSLNLHNGARNILRWISHLSYLFKEWESSWEGKKPSHMQLK